MDDVVQFLFFIYHCLRIQIGLGVEVIAVWLIDFIEGLL